MKVRSGFVSNSSSSSFILVFDKKPESKEELSDILGPVSYDDWGTFVSHDQIIERILNDISNNKPACNAELISEFSNIMEDYDKRWDIETKCKQKYQDLSFQEFINGIYGNGCEQFPEIKAFYDELDVEVEDRVQKLMDKDKYIVVLDYSDNSGSIERALHSGEAFENIEHYVSSHH